MARPLLDPAVAARPRARQLSDVLLIACGLSWGAGLIHVVAAIGHFDQYALYAVFFEVLAIAQFAWGVGAYRRPTPALLRVGAVGSLAVVALWVASRSPGLPIGPDPWRPEPVGAIDSIATGDELVLALLVGFQLRSLGPGAFARGTKRLATAAGLALILLSSLAVTFPVHAH